MTLTTDELKEKAENTLRDADAFQVPVPIERVVRHLNLTIEAAHLEDIAGVLVVIGDSGAIGYNSAHSVIRSRFHSCSRNFPFPPPARRPGKLKLFADKSVSFRRPGDDLVSPAYRRDVEAQQVWLGIVDAQNCRFEGN
jgi:hypothetical protein